MSVTKKISIYILFLLSVVAACRKDGGAKERKVEPKDFLSGKDYEELIVEIQYMNGQQPEDATVNNLKTFLSGRLNKPGGISITQSSIATPSKGFYSITDIENMEKDNRTKYAKGKKLTAYILFLDGDYSENSGSSKVLGVAYGNTSMAIFGKTIKDYSGGIGQPSTNVAMSTVILHEIGHVIGLVDNGTAMQSNHIDAGNGHHCNNDDCLRYYAVETSDFIANLLGGNVPSLDANCIKDLQSNGGK